MSSLRFCLDKKEYGLSMGEKSVVLQLAKKQGIDPNASGVTVAGFLDGLIGDLKTTKVDIENQIVEKRG